MRCVQKPKFQVFGSKGLGEENKLEKNYFLLHLSFTSSSLLEVYLQTLERFKKFKERSRSVKKKVFLRASTPEKIDQIETSSEFFVKARHVCSCKQPARIILTMSLSSDDHRSALSYQVLNSD